MKALKTSILTLILVPLISVSGLAQRTASEERGHSDRGGAVPSSAGSGVTSRGISAGDYSGASAVTGRSAGPAFSSGPSFSGGASTPGAAHSVPNLTGTSFYSTNSYYQWQSFLWQLQTRYLLDSMYFNRFYRNSEPLLTPQLLKLALREPLTLSSRMVRAAEELEALVGDLEAGKPVSKEDIAEKSREVRDLARKIRQDQSLSFVDRRMDKDLNKDAASDQPGLEAARRLREAVVDLHTQLKAMYGQTSTATVSVNSLTQPSFELLSKRIEKLSKLLDTAVKRS
jgi:hypothetical protein